MRLNRFFSASRHHHSSFLILLAASMALSTTLAQAQTYTVLYSFLVAD
jgi:hypothetical protein